VIESKFQHYNSLDAACTLQCWDAFKDELDPGGFRPAYQMTMNLLPVLSFMQTKGICVDMKSLEVTKKQILQQMAEKQAELNTLCGRELNVNSPKACQQYFYVEKGITPYYRDGSVTTDDKALQRIAAGTSKRPGLREAKLVQEVRGLQKLYSTYLDIRFDEDSRFRSSYNPRGSKFGRLSSSQTIFGTGGNAQNLPQEFKQFLVADPGYVLWEVDKRQAEWVVVAYLTGDANMLSVVESGSDSHVHTASLMFDLPPELIVRENKLVGNAHDADTIHALRLSDPMVAPYAPGMPRTMSCRQCGKKSNHGLNYDEGPNTFALTNEIDQVEAKRIIAMYHSIYPGIRVWYDSVKRNLQRDRALVNCFGRKVRFMDAWGDDLWKAAYSMLPQSSVVDSLNMGMVKCYNDDWLCSSKFLNLDILAQVHDSILFQVPLVVVQDSALFSRVMSVVYDNISPTMSYNGRDFRIATDCKLGLNWGGFHADRNPFGMKELKSIADLPGLLGALQCQNEH
jgi:DNA polymerase I-like protein with 3'-5' exonuclease and polymerase domains